MTEEDLVALEDTVLQWQAHTFPSQSPHLSLLLSQSEQTNLVWCPAGWTSAHGFPQGAHMQAPGPRATLLPCRLLGNDPPPPTHTHIFQPFQGKAGKCPFVEWALNAEQHRMCRFVLGNPLWMCSQSWKSGLWTKRKVSPKVWGVLLLILFSKYSGVSWRKGRLTIRFFPFVGK